MSHCARNSLIAFSRPSISPSTKPRARHRLHREQSSAVSCGVFPNRRRGRALDGTNLYERTFLPRSHSSCAIPSGDETGGRRCEALPKQNNYRDIRKRQRNHETCQTEQGVEDDRPRSIPTHSGPYDRRPVSAYSDGLGHAVHRPDIGRVEKTCVPHSIPVGQSVAEGLAVDRYAVVDDALSPVRGWRCLCRHETLATKRGRSAPYSASRGVSPRSG